ncbi:MAG: nucleoside triphosphate pyrophosphohydrolase [Chiayiivirga sp.]|jgi:ATP diphosphatase|nr:nucleoside triphosphate pyrophosphohydrolase [Chiayiivirga sp.]
MARLRDPQGGCPWDVQQDFASIAPYTIEEAYEVADAIDRGDLADLKDELGDLLLQVVFHAQMAKESGHFDFDDVAASICDKMIRRHPHVFPQDPAGGTMGALASVEDADAQTAAWEAQKKREREADSDDRSALAGIARGLPEWQRAAKLQKRAAHARLRLARPDPVIAKLHEEIEEVRVEFAALAAEGDSGAVRDRLEDEIGDVLFVCVNLARHAKVDFGAALRRANHKFERRFRRMEQLAAGEGVDLATQPLQAQDAYWDRAKAEEKSASSSR